MSTSTRESWELWLFAGPRAACGLYKRGDELGLVGSVAGQPSTQETVTRAVARALGEVAELPPHLRILAETISEPSLLQRLTREWPAHRVIFEPGRSVSEPSCASSGSRELGSFIDWAKRSSSGGARRVLVVLGDVLQAIDEEPVHAMVTGGGRPTYPSTVVIKKKTETTETTYRWTPPSYVNDARAGDQLTPEQLLAEVKVVESRDWRITATFGSTDTIEALEPLRIYFGLSSRGSEAEELASVNDDERSARRIAAIVGALREHHAETFDLLVTDSSEFTHLAALRQIAPQVEVVISSQLAVPVAGQPLGDLIEALVCEDPPCSIEALANKIVQRGDARGKSLWLRCQNFLEAQPIEADSALLTTAKRMLETGFDAVALRTRHAEQLATVVDQLGRQALTQLESGVNPLSEALRGYVQEARRGSCAGAGDLSKLGELIDQLESERYSDTASLRELIADTVIAQRDRRDYSEDQPLCGLSLALSLPSPSHTGPASTDSWAAVLELLEPRPQLAWSTAERQTLEDMQVWTARTHGSAQSTAATATTACFEVLEYAPNAERPSFELEADLSTFLDTELRQRVHVRHLALVVRARSTPRHPCSITITPDGVRLSITSLAQCLRDALHAHGRQALALLVLEDWTLLSLEVAYELRDVADVLVTGLEGSGDPVEVNVADPTACETAAIDRLNAGGHLDSGRPFDQIASEWRRMVAQELGKTIKTTQSINLQSLEGLCRRFDRLCQIMLDNLDEPCVRNALEAGFDHESLQRGINYAQMEPSKGLYSAAVSGDKLAKMLHLAMGSIYNWICFPGQPAEQGGALFWVRNELGKAECLRLDTAPERPKDYLALSFHQNVRLHALLTAWRLLRRQRTQADPLTAFPLWSLISLGLTHGPVTVRNSLLTKLDGADSNLGYFYTTFGPPPLMTLSLESDSGSGYELHLSSSESKALLFRQQSHVNLEAVDRSLEGLDFLLARGTATHELWTYLESLGSSLAEDVISRLLLRIEGERHILLDAGRGQDIHLALALPRELMRYPWELMVLPAARGDRELLGERFAIGRQMWSTSGRRAQTRGANPIRVLIIGDPKTASGASLPGARKEAAFIAEVCQEIQETVDGTNRDRSVQEMDFRPERDVFIGRTVTRTGLRRLLREGEYDVLHFAGHGTYVAAQPEASGWLLSDGLLTATELSNTLAWTKNPPWLIFANACNSGMVSDQRNHYQGEVHGLADACIREGVAAFISPLWKINDESARLLASEFYRAVLVNRATVGLALHRARRYTRKVWEHSRGYQGAGDISWAGMVLFGNPTEKIRESVLR